MQTTFISGPVGKLQAVIEQPSTLTTPQRVAIVCHPHPLFKGTMNNKVVTTLTRVFLRLGATTIKFNFRGVGQSEGEHAKGVGELDDLRAVIQWANEQYTHSRLMLAGFSFGAYIATKVATEVSPDALVIVAPAVHHQDYLHLPTIKFPLIVAQGEADEIVPADQVFAWLDTLSNPFTLLRFPGVGHFFHGQLIPLRDQLIDALQLILS